MHPLDQLMACTVRIEASIASGGTATGSGFVHRLALCEDGTNIPAIITNKHVVDGAYAVSVPVNILGDDGSLSGEYEVVSYAIGPHNVIKHPDPRIYLCAIMSGPIEQQIEAAGKKPSFVTTDEAILATKSTFDELLPMEEVTMIGYPNGLWDKSNNGALARRGIIATIPRNNYLGRPEFVVDMACFPGSSGSPVFLANFGGYTDRSGSLVLGGRIKLLGVLYAGSQYSATGEIVLAPVPTKNVPIPVTSIPNNLGYVIKATEINKIDELARQMLPSGKIPKFK